MCKRLSLARNRRLSQAERFEISLENDMSSCGSIPISASRSESAAHSAGSKGFAPPGYRWLHNAMIAIEFRSRSPSCCCPCGGSKPPPYQYTCSARRRAARKGGGHTEELKVYYGLCLYLANKVIDHGVILWYKLLSRLSRAEYRPKKIN